MKKIIFPSQCTCGHLYLERFLFKAPNANGEIGFCWCGFCRTKHMIKPIHVSRSKLVSRKIMTFVKIAVYAILLIPVALSPYRESLIR